MSLAVLISYAPEPWAVQPSGSYMYLMPPSCFSFFFFLSLKITIHKGQILKVPPEIISELRKREKDFEEVNKTTTNC